MATGFHNLSPTQLRLTVAGLMLAMFVGALDQTVVGTAMPRIIAELQGFEHYAWVTTAYMLTSTLGVPIFGKLSDIYGRKYFYIAGIVTFLIGSWLCGFAQNMEQLIAFRALQGVGAGISEGLAFAIIGDIFPPARRARMQGMFGAVFGLASIIGPTLGGYLTDNLSWRWTFYVNMPVGAAALFMLWFFFPYFKPDASVRRKIDWLGVLTLLGSTTPFLLALSWGGNDYPWGSPTINGLFALAAVMFAAFVAIEIRQARTGGEPVLPLDLFREPIYIVSVLATVIIGFGMFGTILYIPLFIQGVLGTSATQSGTVMWPMMFGMLTASIGAGQLIQRTGRYKIFGIAGLAIMSVGMFLNSQMTADSGYWVAARNMVVLGFGMGMTFPVFSLAVQNAVPYRVMGIAMSSLQFFRTLGGMIGAAIMGAVMTNAFAPEFAQRSAPAVQKLTDAVNAIPSDVKAQLPAQAQAGLAHPAAIFSNPQILLSPEAIGQIQQMFAKLPGGQEILDQMLVALRGSLALALDHVYLAGTGVLLVGFVVSLFLGERPLRQTNFDPHGHAGPVEDTEAVQAAEALLAEGAAITSEPATASRPASQRDDEPERELVPAG